jgi:hypothetical protein
VKGFVGRRAVGLLQIVAEPFIVVLIANVEFRLDGAGFAYDFGNEIAILQIEDGFVFGEVARGLGSSGFEQSYFQTGFRESFAGPPTRGSRSYD